jgi:signal transduction histidine kinase
VIVEQAGRMAGIIRGLLDFAHQGDAPKLVVDVRQVATETVALLQPLANRRGCTISLSARAPAVAAVDVGQIRQVLTNLLMNAVQAMTEGGAIRVSVEVAPDASPPPHVRPARGWIAIHVRDEGPGIAPEILAHVFDPFFTTKDVGEGTGLGLSIAFGIVRDHGGWIDVKSRIGRGAELVVHLPQAGAA